MGYGTLIDCLAAAIANVRSFIQTVTSFLLKVFTGLIAGWTGSALYSADQDLSAGIRFLAMIAMDAEILRVIE